MEVYCTQPNKKEMSFRTESNCFFLGGRGKKERRNIDNKIVCYLKSKILTLPYLKNYEWGLTGQNLIFSHPYNYIQLACWFISRLIIYSPNEGDIVSSTVQWSLQSSY